jgi:hypothetical protein
MGRDCKFMFLNNFRIGKVLVHMAVTLVPGGLSPYPDWVKYLSIIIQIKVIITLFARYTSSRGLYMMKLLSYYTS